MRIIRRYIWREFIQYFMICFLIFTVLGIGKIFFDYNDIFIGYRMTSELIFKLLLNQIPYLWMDVLPACALCGALLAMGRLLRENELDVIRLNGAGPFAITLPVFVGVTLICSLAFWWYDQVVPSANHRFEKEIRRLSSQQDMPLIKAKIVIKAPQERFVYLKQVDRQRQLIKGIIILETKTHQKWPRLITATEGKINGGNWQLLNGIIHTLDEQGAVIAEASFKKLQINMTNDLLRFIKDDKKPSELQIKELYEIIKSQNRSGLNNPVYAVFYHEKFAFPFISLVLVFLAIPLALATGRRSFWIGLLFSLLIILAFYTIQVIARSLGTNGIIKPWLAAWAPNIIFFIVGLGLLLKVEFQGG